MDSSGLPMGWQYVDANDFTEIYAENGQLLSISTRTGFTQSLTYDVSNRLALVTGPFERTLRLNYDVDGRLETMTDPAGNPYSYTYNGNGNLASVTYPDETPSEPSDNPSRQYHYEDAAHPDALTGITDERGVMYVTWTYDAQGRATSSSRAGGADRVTLTYDDSTGTSTLS